MGLAWLAVPDSASNPSVDARTPHNHIAKRRMLVTTKTEFHNQFTVQCGAQHTTSWSIKESDVDEAHMYYLTRMTIYEDLAYHLRGTHHSQHNLCLHHCTDDTPPTRIQDTFFGNAWNKLGGCNIPECGKFPAPQSTAESNLSHHLLLLWKLYDILPSTHISMCKLSLKHSKF